MGLEGIINDRFSLVMLFTVMLGGVGILWEKVQDYIEQRQIIDYSDIVRAHPGFVQVLSPAFEILLFNDHLLQLLGKTQQEVVGRKCYDVFGQRELCSNCPAQQAISSRQLTVTEDLPRMIQQTVVYMSQTATPIFRDNGALRYVVVTAVDTTDRQVLKQQNKTMFLETVTALSHLIDSRDPLTKTHSDRVRELALMIGREMRLTEDMLEELAISALLHDIGKIGIPEHILHKKGRLLPEEFYIIQRHTEIGYDALKYITSLEHIARYVLYHHEAFDGSGYPHQLAGAEIPLVSRILAVADVYEALTAERVYRPALSREEALVILLQGAGTKFDPQVLAAFFHCIEQGLTTEVQNDYNRQCIANLH